MTTRPCLDCGQLTNQTRCPQHQTQHQRAKDNRRGTTSQRGYDTQHQHERQAWTPIVNAGQAQCRRCGQPITPGTAWDLGHPDTENPAPKAPEHAYACNRAAAGRSSHVSQ